jgi:2-polyprenyl-6-methoxyphenol hydroxylase-like FAD-dependent oxidoreductase
MTKKTALVVGAGIGGLTAARALTRAGFDVRVIEQAAELKEVGAGISLWPNAVKALRLLGLGEAVEAAGATAKDAGFFTWRGSLLAASPAEQLEARFGAPLLVLHRAELQRLLYQGLDSERVRLGTACVAVEQRDGQATVRLADGSVAEARVIVGGDGIHSAVREAVFGGAPTRYSGFTAWRGVVVLDSELDERLCVGESFGPGSLFGTARLTGGRAYWWASIRTEEDGDDEDPKTRLREHFSSWRGPARSLIEATPDESIIRTPLYERPPLQHLSRGRVALLGDAAHPMLPNLGQGACQAIEDAVELGVVLSQTQDVLDALPLYSARRASRTAAVVRASRQMAKIAHLRSPLAAASRNALMRVMPPSASLRRLTPTVGYEIEGAER